MKYLEKKDDEYDIFLNSYENLYLNQKSQKGLSFLCKSLDNLTGGIQVGTILSIVGGPGSMKTTYAINLAYNAICAGKNVVYFSLEESPLKLTSKLLSRVSVDIDKVLSVSEICNNELSSEKLEILTNQVIPYLKSRPGQLHMISEKDLISYETTEIERQLKMVDDYIKKEKGNDCGVDVIVVDHIQLLKYGSDVADEYKVINSYVSFFRKQSLSFLGTGKEIIVILLSQVNREGIAYARKNNGQYLMQHVAEASEVERASSYIISVYTDGMNQVTKLLTLGAIKLRGSQLPLSVINVFADGEHYDIGDISTLEQQEGSDTNTVIPKLKDYSMDDVLNNSTTLDNSKQLPNNLGFDFDNLLGGFDF